MRWCWIDRILVLDKGSRCVAIKNVSLAEEHLHDHFPGTPVMPASLMIEGMAQTAGILTGHARGFKEKVILAKIGKATFDCEVYPGQSLIYDATLDRIDEAGASTTGIVRLIDPHTFKPDAERGNASGSYWESAPQIGVIELMFSHIDQNMRGLGFPDHNFVFTDQFMNLLKNSGFDPATP
jgi:3-hydroxyacyl-[acyl-carrier-protein] dehydratase